MINSFTIKTKGKEKWFTGNSDEKGETYSDVFLAPSQDGPKKPFRAKVSLQYPYGVIMTKDQAKCLQLDMKTFSCCQISGMESIDQEGTETTPTVRSVPFWSPMKKIRFLQNSPQ